MPDAEDEPTHQLVRILIADDHPVVRDGLRGMFAGEPDFEVVADAADGREAVARVELFDPDVVLMDLRMPHMDGVTAINALVAGGSR
jgi:YesN/AraC family two-component response regulator